MEIVRVLRNCQLQGLPLSILLVYFHFELKQKHGDFTFRTSINKNQGEEK